MSGSRVAARTAATTFASTAGSCPKVCPPDFTFGQLTFISMAFTGLDGDAAAAASRRFATSAYSSIDPPQMLTMSGGTFSAPHAAPTVRT